MSAFAVIYQLSDSNTLGSPSVFDEVMGRLSHRGPDGSNAISADHITMGYWHFWTTAEEVGEYQPLKLEGCPFRIVFDGRIDNRDELFAMLSIPSVDGKTLSDAALTLQAYARWGEDCFEKIVGEFALVIFDDQINEVIAARDPLGDRTLFYAFFGTQLVIASEPWAVAGASLSKPAINESTVAHYFAVRTSQDGQTFFKNVFELLPAHILKANPIGHRLWRYWSPDPYKRIRYKDDAEYAGQFRSLLEESIRSRMRASLPIGILMSGGLDSTSVACFAARMIAPKILTTISYVFDELSDADERHYIASMEEKYGIHSIQVACDNAWTFRNWNHWPHNPNEPEGNLYRMVLEHVFQRARMEGLQILLTGHMGDHLYLAGHDWIADLIVDGHLLAGAKELILQMKNLGWKKTVKTGHIRRTVRRAMDSIWPGAIRFPRQDSSPDWINSTYKAFFKYHNTINRVFERHGMLLEMRTSNDIAHEFHNTNRHQIELRNPFRDRRLIEFMLAIPAYQIFRYGIFRYVLRTAMRDILPEIIRTRRTKTSFISLYHRGVERENDLLMSYTKAVKAEWRKFFHTDWQSKMPELARANGIEALLPFLCVSYETWHRSFAPKN